MTSLGFFLCAMVISEMKIFKSNYQKYQVIWSINRGQQRSKKIKSQCIIKRVCSNAGSQAVEEPGWLQFSNKILLIILQIIKLLTSTGVCYIFFSIFIQYYFFCGKLATLLPREKKTSVWRATTTTVTALPTTKITNDRRSLICEKKERDV